MLRSRAKSHAPRQARSLRTQERLLDAFEALLEEREVADITVDDIVARAHTSVGAFYKRFASKQDLLPLLLSRLQVQARHKLEEYLLEPQHQGCTLAERIGTLIDVIAESQVRQRRLIAAFVAARYSSALQMSPEDIAEAKAMMNAMRNWLLARRDEIRHEHPETAVGIGLYLCLQSLQTALLFETLPPAITRETLIEEAKRLLRRYLCGSTA